MQNKDKFSLIILGSGTMLPTKKRHPSSYLIQVDGKVILLDCGHSTVVRLIEKGINLRDIDIIFISHFHTDHFSDLLPLVHARWIDDKFYNLEHKSLTILGPKTLRSRFRKLRSVMWPEPNEYHPLNWRESSIRKIYRFNGIIIRTFPVVHVPWFKSAGISIIFKNKKLVYSGDISGRHPQKNLRREASGADLLIIETAAKEKNASTHFSVEEAIQLTKEIKVKKVLLTHIREQRISTVNKMIYGINNMKVAQDNMKVRL